MNNGMFATLGRLIDTYYEQHERHLEETRRGNCHQADAVWQIVLLLGGILGKTTEEIEHDRKELS